MLALVNGSDSEYFIYKAERGLLREQTTLLALVKSRMLINIIARKSCAVEHRLQIVTCGMIETFKKGEVRQIGRNPGSMIAVVLKQKMFANPPALLQ